MSTKLLPRKATAQGRHALSIAEHADDEGRAKWRALHREAILEPEIPIVDSHHHLWDRPGNRYLLDDYLADVRTGHQIVASVFVECGAFYRRCGPAALAPVGQVDFANGMAAMAESVYGTTRVCAGIVGTADLTAGGEAEQVLDAQMAVAGERFKGIRLSTKRDPDEDLNTTRYIVPRDLMQDRDFRAGFAALGPRKLSFDAMIYHPQIPELADLARAFPETTIVVNHIGGLLAWTRTYASRREEAISHWRASMAQLATCPNVYVKLGGLGMSYLGLGFDQRDAPASSVELAKTWAPLLEHCIDTFSPRRCMFESNFPPDRESVTFPVIWNTFKRIAARYSTHEKRALFHDTAANVYRLDTA